MVKWTSIGTILSLLLACLVHGLAAVTVVTAVEAAQSAQAQRHGQMVVGPWFYDTVGRSVQGGTPPTPAVSVTKPNRLPSIVAPIGT
ncbi:hypothetical protein P0F65_00050 [Sphingomonas sp. I4]